jgi:hypothetical protein
MNDFRLIEKVNNMMNDGKKFDDYLQHVYMIGNGLKADWFYEENIQA